MAPHLSAEVMNGYARRSLAPLELLAADDHLGECPACRERICDESGLKEATQSLLRALRPMAGTDAGHLTYEQLESQAEGILGRAEREIINAHLGRCSLCASEARDFTAFARSARTLFDTGGSGPAGSSTTADRRSPSDSRRAAAEAPAPARAGLRPAASEPAAAEDPLTSIAQSRGLPWRILIPVLAVGAAVAIAAAWLVPAMLRRQVGDLTAQIEALRKVNADLVLQAEQAERLRADLERSRSESAPAPPAGQEPAEEPALPSAALTLADRRGSVGLDANGDLIGLDALSVAAGRSIAAALRSGRVETPPELQDLAEGSAPSAREGDAGVTATPLSPVATIVRDARPTFSWRARPGATGYTVEVFDAGLNAVARSESLTRTSWRVGRPLKRGEIYVWQVVARLGAQNASPLAPPTAADRFKVMGSAESTALERDLRDAEGSRLAAGVLLARAGCLDDARKELQELAKGNPESPLARDLLKSLAAVREAEPGRPEAAR